MADTTTVGPGANVDLTGTATDTAKVAVDLVHLADGVESGYKTTEFWGKVVVQAVGLLVLTGVIKPDVAKVAGDPVVIQYVAGALAMVVPEIVYAISRGIRKAQHSDRVVNVNSYWG